MIEPCPECGGLQVDMGRGRVRCLKHEGEPARFAARADADSKVATNGKVASRNGKVVKARKVTPVNGKANGKVAKPRRTPAKPRA